MAGRYPKKYQAVRDTAKKLRKWINVVEDGFIPALNADDTGSARKKTYNASKFIPYYATQLVSDMHRAINQRRDEMAAEDGMAADDGGEVKSADVLRELVDVANDLDVKGFDKEADELTNIIKEAAEEDMSAHSLLYIRNWLSEKLTPEQKKMLAEYLMEEASPEVPAGMDDVSFTDPVRKSEAATLIAMQKIASDLDEKGLCAEADLMDEAIRAFADKEDFGQKSPEVDVESCGYTDSPCLSTGFCPDHRGTRLVNVDDQVYQCPVDGKVYDWMKGFTDASGNKYPGGSVAEQTAADTHWNTSIPRWFSSK